MSTPTDAALLLQACREQPEELTPRLMLADALRGDGFCGAADYIAESIEYSRVGRLRAPGPRRRKSIADGYAKWLESILGINHHPALIGGTSWDTFHWRRGEKWDVNECRLDIERGLPSRMAISCPMFMEQASKLLLFPLTEVKVTNRVPDRDDVVPPVEYLWIWATWPQTWNTWEDTPYEIPDPLYKLLPIDDSRPHMSRGRYSTPSRAYTALNAAALAFGRATLARTSCAAQPSV